MDKPVTTDVDDPGALPRLQTFLPLNHRPGSSMADALRGKAAEKKPSGEAASQPCPIDAGNQEAAFFVPQFTAGALLAEDNGQDSDDESSMFSIPLSPLLRSPTLSTPMSAIFSASPLWESPPLDDLKARVEAISSTSADTARQIISAFPAHRDDRDCIGNGTFGQVFRVHAPQADGPAQAWAIKSFDPKSEAAGLHEVKIFSHLSKNRKALPGEQDHVARYVGATAVRTGRHNQILLAMDMIDGLSVKHLHRQLDGLNQQERLLVSRHVASDAASGLCDLLSWGLVHNDAQENNFICDEQTHRVKTLDFSKTDLVGALMSPGHPFYCGPERVRANGGNLLEAARLYSQQRNAGGPADAEMDTLLQAFTLDEKTDSFGLGQMIHKMVTGKLFLALDINDELELRRGTGHRPDDVRSLETGTMLAMEKLQRRGVIYRASDQTDKALQSCGFYDFINKAIHPDIGQRWSMPALRDHPFLAQSDPGAAELAACFDKIRFD